jgi:phage/plasmid-like protein (TIGR03299 family)
MSHELTERANGFVEFAYLESDGAAWHGLGQPVADKAPLETWVEKSGMDWRIQRSKVRYAVERGQDAASFAEMPGQHVLFRSDTKAPLGLVSDGYKVVQPKDVLKFFADIAHAQGIELSAAGTLFGGKKFWATAKIGEASPVSVKDRIGGYLLLSSGSDGGTASEARLTSTRVVCNNTLQMAFADSKASVRVTHRSVFDADAIRAELGLTEHAWAAFRHSMTRLANVPVDGEAADRFLVKLLANAAPDAPKADVARQSRGYKRILSLFNGEAKGSNLDGVRDTAYGMLQAVTEYVDHWAGARSADNRFASAQWGPGNDLKNSAYALLTV